MSSVAAFLALAGFGVVAGFGGGLAFAYVLARKLNAVVDQRIQQWAVAAGEAVASTRKEQDA